MFERPRGGERAVLVHVQGTGAAESDDISELKELAASAGAEACACVVARLRRAESRTLLGKGKLEEVAQAVSDGGAELVIVNFALSPAQERNLERALQCRVLDRIGLILDIFAQRASTFEGKLQVELAQLRHLSTRLVRGWTHLERQKGGIGLRGPGETQLETDRRLVNDRIRRIEERLQRVSRRRALSRKARARAGVPVVSLVGYTNAGKSTLFNALTGSNAFARDLLFATLDPTLRRVTLPGSRDEAILVDTVGFIRDLPTELVAAFRATLEETQQARLLLHVVDASAVDHQEKKAQVNQVLEDIGAGEVPQIEVYNKIDLLQPPAAVRVDRDVDGMVRRVWLSAEREQGLADLMQAVAAHLARDRVAVTVRLEATDGRLRAKLFELGEVLGERVADDGSSEVQVVLDAAQADRLRKHEGLVTLR
jgi:GTP-binding protein HflX